jgi:hypothetical protein
MTPTGDDRHDADSELRRQFAAVRGQDAGLHPSEDDWVRFAARDLDPASHAAFADHIVACAECALVYRAVAHVRRGAAEIDDGAGTRSSRGWWRGLAAAAAIAAVVGGSAWWMTRPPPADGRAASGGTVIAPQPAPAPRSGEPAPPASNSAEPVEWARLLGAPEIRLPTSLALTMRGGGGDAPAFLVAFGAAIAPYRAGRFSEAETALAALTAQRPDVVETWFYLGVSRLFSQSPATAVEPLRRARSSEVVGDEARWFEAVALQHAGRVADARMALSALCAAPGPNRTRSCDALRTSR